MEELGVRERAAYPGLSEDPLDGFRHLADDIQRFAADFLTGDASILLRAAVRERAHDASKNRALMTSDVGDVRRRAEARRKFDERDWKGVISLLESLEYPDQMDAADQRRLEIARRRIGAT